MAELSPTQESVLRELALGNRIVIDMEKRDKVNRRMPRWQQEPAAASKTVRWSTLDILIRFGYVVSSDGAEMRRFDPGTVFVISAKGRSVV